MGNWLSEILKLVNNQPRRMRSEATAYQCLMLQAMGREAACNAI